MFFEQERALAHDAPTVAGNSVAPPVGGVIFTEVRQAHPAGPGRVPRPDLSIRPQATGEHD